jgi:hypothetical protein
MRKMQKGYKKKTKSTLGNHLCIVGGGKYNFKRGGGGGYGFRTDTVFRIAPLPTHQQAPNTANKVFGLVSVLLCSSK